FPSANFGSSIGASLRRRKCRALWPVSRVPSEGSFVVSFRQFFPSSQFLHLDNARQMGHELFEFPQITIQVFMLFLHPKSDVLKTFQDLMAPPRPILILHASAAGPTICHTLKYSL